MKLVTLDCTNCGAPLEGWAGRKSLRCEYCGTSVLVAEARKAPSKDEVTPAERLFPSEAHKDLHELDRRWRRERTHLVRRNKSGGMVVPTNFDAILGGVLIAAMGIVFLGRDEGVFMAPMFGIAGFVVAIIGIKRARAYESAHRRYRQKRRRVLGEIAEQRG